MAALIGTLGRAFGRFHIGLGIGFGVSLCFGFRFGLLLRLFGRRRPFGRGLLHDGFLRDSFRLDAGSGEIADAGRGLGRLGVHLGVGFGFRLTVFLAIPLGIGSR